MSCGYRPSRSMLLLQNNMATTRQAECGTGADRTHDYILREQYFVLELEITNMASVRIFEVTFDKFQIESDLRQSIYNVSSLFGGCCSNCGLLACDSM
jgi:hypothetical protein